MVKRNLNQNGLERICQNTRPYGSEVLAYVLLCLDSLQSHIDTCQYDRTNIHFYLFHMNYPWYFFISARS